VARVAVVGSGLAGFVAYQTLRRTLEPGEIAVFGTDADPAAVWRVRAAAIRQREMRSESDGHCSPTSFPGLAFSSLRGRRSLRPLLESAVDRYHPTVDEFLLHVERLRVRSGWDESLVLRRVESVRTAVDGFEVEGERFRHVLLALGHPGLNVPDELRDDPRAVHAYEPHDYASTVAVVGAGLAAATEWLNALAAGSEVVSVRRREPTRRPLTVPRQYFSLRGLAGYHRLAPRERIERLRTLTAPSYPAGAHWDEPLERAERERRFRVEPSLNGSAQVICATGFRRGFRHDRLLSRLVAEHELETADGWLVLAPDSTVRGLTDERRTLAVAGAPAQWAFPAADTLAGARYAAHRFLRRIESCPTR
jgi:cation diffusion facilitator CzcD-associated flavoprotein CzcO